jgi:F pilus assembly protein of type IV secretion system
MFILRKSNNTISSRRQINIKAVKDNILMLPNDNYRAVLRVSSVNFELKSEEEQDVLIETYQSFLNSLSCPLQIIVRVRELDMDKYLNDLELRLQDEKEEVYHSQIRDYARFIQDLVKDSKILTRNFYTVVPYNSQRGIDFRLIKEQLNLNCDIVTKGLLRLGMHSQRLSSLEILDLFYLFYNPNHAKSQPITHQTLQSLYSVYVRKGDQA